jgi:hypothetical protein
MELDMKSVASYLWKLLDDIDTASDIAKGDNELYRVLVETIGRKRFEVGDTDGHTVVFIPNYFSNNRK